MSKFGVFLHGLSLAQGNFRPAMIFKDRHEREVLPVWLDPVDANLLLVEAQNIGVRSNSAHNASFKIFEALGVKLKSVYFDEVTGSGQSAMLEILQDKKEVAIRLRAAEALPLAVKAGCEFYTNKDVVEKSRALTLEYLLHMERVPGQLRREEMH